MTQVTQKIPEGYKQTEIGVIPEDWKLVSYGKLSIFCAQPPVLVSETETLTAKVDEQLKKMGFNIK